MEENEKLRERVRLEEKALDSFGNLVLGVITFWRETGRWPKSIVVISHEFKRARFLDLHVKAMRWPKQKVMFEGVDPAFMVVGSEVFDEGQAKSVRMGEKERGFRPWEVDLYGMGEWLREKRKERNFWGGDGKLFANEEERRRSGVVTWVDGDTGEEGLVSGATQPWEEWNEG